MRRKTELAKSLRLLTAVFSLWAVLVVVHPAQTESRSPGTKPGNSHQNLLSDEEAEEVGEAAHFFSEQTAGANLAKLLAAFADYDFTEREIAGFRAELPARFRDRLVAAPNEQLNRLAAAIFAVYKLKNRRVLLYESEAPLVALWKGYYALISSQTVKLLDREELAGQIAHESAHLFFMDELRRAREAKNERAVRIIELKCDAVAMFALIENGQNPAAVIRGLTKMTDELTVHQLIQPVSSHPSLPARGELSKNIIKTFGKK